MPSGSGRTVDLFIGCGREPPGGRTAISLRTTPERRTESAIAPSTVLVIASYDILHPDRPPMRRRPISISSYPPVCANGDPPDAHKPDLDGGTLRVLRMRRPRSPREVGRMTDHRIASISHPSTGRLPRGPGPSSSPGPARRDSPCHCPLRGRNSRGTRRTASSLRAKRRPTPPPPTLRTTGREHLRHRQGRRAGPPPPRRPAASGESPTGPPPPPSCGTSTVSFACCWAALAGP